MSKAAEGNYEQGLLDLGELEGPPRSPGQWLTPEEWDLIDGQIDGPPAKDKRADYD